MAADTESVGLFASGDGVVVSALPSLVEPLRSVVSGVPFTATGARDLLESVVDNSTVSDSLDVSEALGPQFVGYCDLSTFRPVHAESSVGAVAPESLAPLREATPAEEWGRAGVRTDDDAPTFAVEVDGRPLAATQYSVAHGTAGIEVVSHPEHRGEGYATLAVSLATDHALVPEYRTLEEWSSSVALAARLGFERFGRSLLVRLPESTG